MASEPGDPPTPDVDKGQGLDPVAGLAIACGVLGIFVAQLLLVLVTAILASIAGRRARDGYGDVGYAYTAFAVAGVDGILVLVSLVANGHAPPLIPR